MNYPEFVLSLGSLVAYWRMGELAGAHALSDLSGNGHGGTFSGTVTLAQTGGLDGDSDKAMRFQGGYCPINHHADLNLNGNFSIACLLKANTTGASQWPGPLVNGASSGANGYCVLYDSNANVYLQRNGVNCPIGGGVVIGEWHHLVFTYDGTYCRGYKDGVLINTTEVTFPTNSQTGDTKVGYGLTTGDFVADELALFSDVLTVSEIEVLSALALGDDLPHSVEGTVDDGLDAVECTVRAYRRDTGLFLAEITSNPTTGDFTLPLVYDGAVDVIAHGPTGERPLSHNPPAE